MDRLNGELLARGLHRRSLLSLVVAGGVLSRMSVRAAAAQDKPTVKIGSKDFTEQVLINEMLAQLLEDAGYPVERQLNLGGSAIVHQALVNGDIDTYIEYTGTGLLAILNLTLEDAATPTAGAAATPMAGVDPVYETVKREYKDQFNLVWLDPLGFNNTYTLALTQEKAQELGVTKISDLVGKANDLTFGGTQEFLTRPDGLPGLTAAYEGLEFGDAKGFDPGLVYQAVDSGDVDVISAFATDGRIPALGLVTLEDDLGFFPPYFAAPVVRQDLLDQDAAVADVINMLAGKIDDQTMADLNSQIDVEGMEPEDVARAFLQEQGLIGQ
ncbi:MAG TPA: glycine betaine ABC transporter substrate-binding protein [Gemmatimonadales bacterium]|nr:glycine betaine ABC transporter substrate-binding protein [Gemmatimonadales bacterium]